MLTVNERSGIEVEVRFFGTDNAPSIPSAVYWRLDCESTQEELRGWTALTPTPTYDSFGNLTDCYALIEVPGSLNAMRNPSARREVKSLLVVSQKDQPREYSEEFRYTVRNLQGRQ